MEELETVEGSAAGAYAKVIILHAIYLAILLIIYLVPNEEMEYRPFYLGLGMTYSAFFALALSLTYDMEYKHCIEIMHLRSRMPLLLSRIGIIALALTMILGIVFQLSLLTGIGGLLATALIFMLTFFCPQVAGIMLVALYKQFRGR